MQKRNFAVLILLVVTISCLAFGLSACSTRSTTSNHIHTYSTQWSYDADYHWQACLGCDEVRNKDEHDWNSGIITVAPTTTAEGIKTFTCETCSHTKVQAVPIVVEEHEHIFNKQIVFEKYIDTVADCINTATYYYSCECGECGTNTFEYGDALGHSFTDYKYNSNATCTEDGTKTAKCDRCDITDTIVASGTAVGHSYSDEWSKDEDYHWHAATCEHDEETKDQTEHTWENGVVSKEATEEEEGVIIFSCGICGQKKTASIPTLPKVKKYNVIFYDYDNTILATEQVLPGESAEAPEISERVGFRFDKWDQAFDNVQSDLYVIAQYIKIFMVTFVDYDNSIIDTQEIDIGNSAKDPNIPVREGYSFSGWNMAFADVQMDLTIKAQYDRLYTIIFRDYDGTTLSTQQVKGYDEVELPTVSAREGYTFTGWNSNFDFDENNYADIIITAIYEINIYIVRFVLPDGAILDEQSVPYGYYAEEPTHENAYFVKAERKCYSFTRWSADFGYISKDTEIMALYEDLIADPTIVVLSDVSGRNATVEVYLVGYGISMYGLDIKLECELIIEGYTVKGENMREGGNTVVSLDATNKKIELVYSGSGNSIAIDGLYEIIEMSFTIPLAENGEIKINVAQDSYLVDGTLNKVIPIIISGGLKANV